MYLHIIQFISLYLLLLVSGVFWGPWLALHRTIQVFHKEEFIKITQTMASNLGRPMQVLMPLCIGCMLISVWIFPDKSTWEFYFIAISLCLTICTLIVTLTVELPIVNTIKQWKAETMPADWEAIRDRWVAFHALRVFPALISFGLYLAAILFSC